MLFTQIKQTHSPVVVVVVVEYFEAHTCISVVKTAYDRSSKTLQCALEYENQNGAPAALDCELKCRSTQSPLLSSTQREGAALGTAHLPLDSSREVHVESEESRWDFCRWTTVKKQTQLQSTLHAKTTFNRQVKACDLCAAMSDDVVEPEPKRTCIRGLYDTTDDNVAPEVDNSMFKEVPNRMLRFSTKADCKAFMLKHCKVGSNPQFPYLQHMFTLLVTWEQVQTYLLDKVNMICCDACFCKAPSSCSTCTAKTSLIIDCFTYLFVLTTHQIEYFNKKHPPRIAQPIDRQANVFLQDAATEGPDGAAGWGEFDASRVMAGIRQRCSERAAAVLKLAEHCVSIVQLRCFD
eukprot:19129-Heterococcus_DN1.PRE.1